MLAAEGGALEELQAPILLFPRVGALGRVELVRGLVRQVVRPAGERLGEDVRKQAQPFCGPKPDIDWHDPEARKAHLGELVFAGRDLLAEADAIDDPAVAEPAELLARVDSDVEGDAEGSAQIRQGFAPGGVVSHSAFEMRRRRKSAAVPARFRADHFLPPGSPTRAQERPRLTRGLTRTRPGSWRVGQPDGERKGLTVEL